MNLIFFYSLKLSKFVPLKYSIESNLKLFIPADFKLIKINLRQKFYNFILLNRIINTTIFFFLISILLLVHIKKKSHD